MATRNVGNGPALNVEVAQRFHYGELESPLSAETGRWLDASRYSLAAVYEDFLSADGQSGIWT
jgi:hypothetical protein